MLWQPVMILVHIFQGGVTALKGKDNEADGLREIHHYP